MNMREWKLALTVCCRELRGGAAGSGVFLACLFLGVLAISSVGSLGQALEAGLAADARAILGGDIRIALTSRELGTDEQAWLHALPGLDALSRTLTTRAMARAGQETRPEEERAALVEIKGVDQLYPLYGQVEMSHEGTLQELLAVRDGLPGAIADPELLRRLGLQVGDVIQVGTARIALRAILHREPDQSAEFRLGPRLLVSMATVGQSGLTQPGSLFRAEYLLRLRNADAVQTAEQIRTAWPESGWQVQDYAHAAPHVRSLLERLRIHLGLVGLATLLVGGLGISSGVRGYLNSRLAHIAVMKCLGGSVRTLFAAYLLQTLALGGLGILAGVCAGALAPWAGAFFTADVLPIQIRRGVYATPLIQAALFGLTATLAFALPPLFRAMLVRPAGIFRGVIAEHAEKIPRPALLPITAAFVALAALVVWFTGNTRLSAWFLGVSGLAAVLFSTLDAGVHRLAQYIPTLPWTCWNIGLAAIRRPGSPGMGLILGFGLSALVTVAMTSSNVSRALEKEIAQEAPDFFFMDIRPEQKESFHALARAHTSRLDLRPMIRGRIVRIADLPVEKAAVSPDVSWAIRGDRGLSWSAEMPSGSTLVRGAWWPADYRGEPLISLSSDLAKGFGVDLGDRLTVNVLGRNLTGTIANIREVNWRTLAMQFAILFSPGALDKAPQSWLGAVYGADAELFQQVSQHFPQVAIITIRDVLHNAARFMSRAADVFGLMAGLMLASGVLVLAGAFWADQHRRRYDAVIYKVCGATRQDIILALLAEFSLSGLGAALGSLLLGTLAAWGVVQGLFGMRFVPDMDTALLAVLAGVSAPPMLGLLSLWRTLGHRAAPYLRNE